MIDLKQCMWGLKPFRENAVAFAGARLLFNGDETNWIPSRVCTQGSVDDLERLNTWVAQKAFPALRNYKKRRRWSVRTTDRFKLRDGMFLFEASPNKSYGYMYISAYIMEDEEVCEGFEEFDKCGVDGCEGTLQLESETDDHIILKCNECGRTVEHEN